MDLSNYPSTSKFFNSENNNKLGYLKDETKSQPILEFIGLRCKMYSYKCENSETKKAKGPSSRERHFLSDSHQTHTTGSGQIGQTNSLSSKSFVLIRRLRRLERLERRRTTRIARAESQATESRDEEVTTSPPPPESQPLRDSRRNSPPRASRRKSPPRDSRRNSPPRDSRRNSPPRDSRRNSPPRDSRRNSPPRDSRRNSPPRDSRRNSPPRDSRRNSPPRDSRRNSPPRDSRRNSPPRDSRRNSPPRASRRNNFQTRWGGEIGPGFQSYGNFNQSEPLNRRLPQDMELFQYNILKKYMGHYVRHGALFDVCVRNIIEDSENLIDFLKKIEPLPKTIRQHAVNEWKEHKLARYSYVLRVLPGLLRIII
ncbi:hypothetical protein TNCT_304251 [Trichonephila clavata]|uniref:Uncharacterized protein n=1 Tax=Trichonephila clavata TaxID=2740835 RepID=A0A8X6FX46_TRICU|nr:hypothetical protein TNCT_304251 [Trichonephila clavata]